MLGFALNYVAVHRTKRQMTPQDDFKFSKAVCVDRESAKSKATEKLSRKLKERVKLSYRSLDPFEGGGCSLNTGIDPIVSPNSGG